MTGSVMYRRHPDFPNHLIGSDGSVWSLYGRSGDLKGHWRRLSGNITQRGYVQVEIRGNRGRQVKGVHRLVLEAFVGPRPEGLEVCHEDGDPANNVISNLRWDTHKANCADAINHGVFPIGNKSGMAKLREENIPEIVCLVQSGLSMRAVARRFGVDHSQISRIFSGEGWKRAFIQTDDVPTLLKPARAKRGRGAE